MNLYQNLIRFGVIIIFEEKANCIHVCVSKNKIEFS